MATTKKGSKRSGSSLMSRFKAKMKSKSGLKQKSKSVTRSRSTSQSIKTKPKLEATLKSKSDSSTKVCEAYNSDDADTDLISSDNVLFKVHSYRLQSASDMIALANSSQQRDSIHLTHPAIEHSSVVKKILDIVYKCDFNFKSVEKDPNLIRLVIDFARKWEISIAIDIIRKEVSRSRRSCQGEYLGHFLVALHLRDNALAVKFLRDSDGKETEPEDKSQQVSGGHKKHQGEGDRFGEEIRNHYYSDVRAARLTTDQSLVASPGGVIFDLNVTPYEDFLRIPPTVVWIILRAQWGEESGGPDADKTIRAMLDLACRLSTALCNRADSRSTVQIGQIRRPKSTAWESTETTA